MKGRAGSVERGGLGCFWRGADLGGFDCGCIAAMVAVRAAAGPALDPLHHAWHASSKTQQHDHQDGQGNSHLNGGLAKARPRHGQGLRGRHIPTRFRAAIPVVWRGRVLRSNPAPRVNTSMHSAGRKLRRWPMALRRMQRPCLARTIKSCVSRRADEGRESVPRRSSHVGGGRCSPP